MELKFHEDNTALLDIAKENDSSTTLKETKDSNQGNSPFVMPFGGKVKVDEMDLKMNVGGSWNKNQRKKLEKLRKIASPIHPS